MNNLKILVVEDNLHKFEKINNFFKENFKNINISHAMSFTSGKKKSNDSDYDILLLDMSLPTYDKTVGESGGRFRTFGGEEIARKLVKTKPNCKFLFLTQYEDFSDKTKSLNFSSLKLELELKFHENCIGFIFYNSTKSNWKNELKEIVEKYV